MPVTATSPIRRPSRNRVCDNVAEGRLPEGWMGRTVDWSMLTATLIESTSLIRATHSSPLVNPAGWDWCARTRKLLSARRSRRHTVLF